MVSEERVRLEQELMKELERFDTPTITNIIATYPRDREYCLGLYDPSEINWYSDETLKCIYPELGPRCGYAVTAVYGMPDSYYNRLEFIDILTAIEESPKPVILALKQNSNEKMKRKNALIGGNMMSAFKALGVTGVIGDGPARDIGEMRPMGVQCMFTGAAAGHGVLAIQGVNVPVDICGMDVAPREVIHMDENGAVKFPAKYLEKVVALATRLGEIDTARQNAISKASGAEEIASIMKSLY